MKEERSQPHASPSLVRLVTSSHDEYLSSFRPLRLRGFILGRASRPWSRTQCRLTWGVLEHGVDAAPWAASGSAAEGVVTFAFAGSPDAQLRVDGREVSRDSLCVWPGGARVSVVARRPADWFVVSLPERDLAGLASAQRARGPGAPAELLRFRPEVLESVRALASGVLEAFEEAGQPALAPRSSASLERTLLAELARLSTAPCLSRGTGAPRIARRHVLERIEEHLDARLSEPVYVADLCAATGLPERTLRYILVEQYGEGPTRLLRSRRLCQLRRCLQAEDVPRGSLARIAERHGFRHMGTLAADYRNLFGELPSETRQASAGFAPAAGRPRADGVLREAFGRSETVPVAMAAGSSGR